MTDEPMVEAAFPNRPRHQFQRVFGWLLLGVGVAWTLAALCAFFFVLSVDRGGTEMVTATLNLALPALMIAAGAALALAGLRRVGPIDLSAAVRRLDRGRRV